MITIGFTFDETINNDDIDQLICIIKEVYNVSKSNVKPYNYNR